MTENPLRTLIVGVGGRGRWALNCCVPEHGFQIIALCDPAPTALSEAGAQLGIPEERRFQDFEQAVRESGAQCMVICAPTRFHVPFAIAGFEAGMAVLTEKGMAPDWESAKHVVSRARELNATFCVAQNYRYNAMERTVAASLNGELPEVDVGDVALGDYIHHRVRPEPKLLTFPFSSLWDMSCHHFDNMLYWLGPIQALTAQVTAAPWSAYPYPQNTAAQLEFSSGCRINYFHGHDSARATLNINLHGRNGALTIAEEEVTYSARPPVNFGKTVLEQVPHVAGLREVGMVRDFHYYITKGIEPGISGRANLEVMAMCQMVVLSSTEGRRVTREELG